LLSFAIGIAFQPVQTIPTVQIVPASSNNVKLLHFYSYFMQIKFQRKKRKKKEPCSLDFVSLLTFIPQLSTINLEHAKIKLKL